MSAPDETSPEAKTEEKAPEAKTEEKAPEAKTEERAPEAKTEDKAPEAKTEERAPEAVTEEKAAAEEVPRHSEPRVSHPDGPRRSRPSLAPAPLPPPSLLDRLRALVLAPLRDPNPILLKELRATFRTALFVRFLYLLTGIVAVCVVLGGAMIGEGNTAPADVGSALFHIFFGLVLGVLCLVAPSYAATAVTTERETRTYESLLLSGMSAWHIVWGKFLAYFGSIVLIVVAIAPVIGVAFLFGGVSPGAVIVAFFWTLVILATAISWGLAVSARLESTRISIVLSTVLFVPSAMMLSGIVTGLGEEAQRAWGTPFDGPFWFAEAFLQRIDTLDGWAALVALPGFVFLSSIWFFLASSVAGLRHPGEDRSTALKQWAAFVSPVSVAAGAIPIAMVSPSLSSVTNMSVFMTMMAGMLGLFVGLVFANEPPLPPRARAKPSVLRRALSVIGPGAAGTTRFALLAAMLPPIGVAFLGVVARHGAGSVPLADEADGALFLVGVGNALVAATFTALAVVFRLWSRNGVVARLLAIVTLATSVLVPVLLSLALQPNVFDYGNRLPPLMAVSPIGPLWGAILLTDRAPIDTVMLSFFGLAMYGGAAFVLWLGIELHVGRVRRADAARRSERIAATAGAAAVAAGGASG